MRVRPWLVAVAAALAACGNGANPTASDAIPDLEADQVMFGVTHYVTADGIRQAVLVADTSFMFNNQSIMELRGVHLTLYHASGQEAAVLTSLTGEFDTRSSRMVARGNVVLVSYEGDRRIETEELYYSPQQNRIWSDVATTLYEDGSVAHGDGFTSDPQLRNVRVTRPHGEFEGLEFKF